jgi:hypothetical protein
MILCRFELFVDDSIHPVIALLGGAGWTARVGARGGGGSRGRAISTISRALVQARPLRALQSNVSI